MIRRGLVTIALMASAGEAAAETTDSLAPRAPAPVAPAPAPAMVPRSVPRRTVGQVFTILGAIDLTAGVPLLLLVATTDAHNEGVNLIEQIGAVLVAEGTTFTTMGIALWATGARMVPARTAQPSTPRVAVGPGSVGLTIPF